MTHPVKTQPQTVLLPNVERFGELTHALLTRAPGLPGFGAFYGPSGFGKSSAAAAVYMRTRCPLVELGDHITRKSLLQAILKELAVPYHKSTSVPDLVEMIVTEFQAREQPLLIIDEADFLVSKKLVELVRSLYNQAQHLSIILIGEELLLHNLAPWERSIGRVLFREAALPCSREDAQALAAVYAPGLSIAGDLLEEIVALAEGSARRVSANLALISHVARNNALDEMDLARFARLSPNKALHSSRLPKPRTFTGRIAS